MQSIYTFIKTIFIIPVYSTCATWTKWSECTGPCDSSQKSKYRWCFTKSMAGTDYIINNVEYRDAKNNESLSVKEEYVQSCMRKGCGNKGIGSI